MKAEQECWIAQAALRLIRKDYLHIKAGNILGTA